MEVSKNILLKLQDVSVSYGAIRALRNVNLEVCEGEIVTLIGANGAGKTSLLNSILGIHRAQSGIITFIGKNITRKSTEHIVSSGLCLVPEGRGIMTLMNVLENLQLGAYHLKGDITKQLERVYRHFPILRERSEQLSGTLSGGEQQMLAVARGAMAIPKLMMLDEPSLGLGPALIEELFKIIVELNQEGITILLAEQNARKALTLANRGYVFQTGEIVMSGTAEELASDAAVQEAYLGG